MLELRKARVTTIKVLPAGLRACIDTCELMKECEGMLTGCQSAGLFLVQAEAEEAPFTTPRPFRVNAGSISLYTLAPGGKAKYLSELKAGDEVLIVNRGGKARKALVGRVKIERRPLVLIEAEIEGKIVKTILQYAETVKLMTEAGSKAVTKLEPGDEVLVHVKEGGDISAH